MNILGVAKSEKEAVRREASSKEIRMKQRELKLDVFESRLIIESSGKAR